MTAGSDAVLAAQVFEIETPSGVARAHVYAADRAPAALVLGHGAGGGVSARDLVAVRDVALAEAVSVALVEQPYRVAGRRSPAPAGQLDAAWRAVIERLRLESFRGLSLICGGRSSGARVACRTAADTGAVGVLCLAFPLQPPGRTASGEPRPDRLHELDAVSAPVLVVQGESDQFGMPPARRGRRRVVVVPGDHSLRSVEPIRSAVRPWLRRMRDRG
ncbi:MAG: alpha/beta hydrolase family protein [Solirubrobacteraceae bacterium]